MAPIAFVPRIVKGLVRHERRSHLDGTGSPGSLLDGILVEGVEKIHDADASSSSSFSRREERMEERRMEALNYKNHTVSEEDDDDDLSDSDFVLADVKVSR